MLRGPHQYRPFDVQRRGIFQKCLLVFRRVLLDRYAIPGCVADDFVVDIGDVHHVADVIPALPQKTVEQVDCNKRPEVSDVTIVVNRRPARIHADPVGLQRLEFFNLCGECVVEAQSHG